MPVALSTRRSGLPSAASTRAAMLSGSAATALSRSAVGERRRGRETAPQLVDRAAGLDPYRTSPV